MIRRCIGSLLAGFSVVVCLAGMPQLMESANAFNIINPYRFAIEGGGIPTSGLFLEYLFATDASDTSPESPSADGTLQNGASVSGGILVLDGSNDYVSVPNTSMPGFPITITGWVDSDNWDRSAIIMHYREPGSGDGLTVGTYTDGSGSLLARTNRSGTYRYGIYTNASVGEWHHFAVTVNSSESIESVYWDGVYVARQIVNGWAVDSGSTFVGRRNAGVYFDGDVDAIRVYDRVLTSNEVHTIYTEGR